MRCLNTTSFKNIITHFVAWLAALLLIVSSSSAMALTDIYFVTGEDLDFLIETDKTYAIEEIEYELRKIPFFREVEDFVFNFNDEYLPESE